MLIDLRSGLENIFCDATSKELRDADHLKETCACDKLHGLIELAWLL